MKEINVKTNKRIEMIDITNKIQSVLDDDEIINGFVLLFVPHTTAAVTINEGADPSVQRDMINKLQNLIPKDENYHHSEGNSDAHIKASLIGSSEKVLINNGKLVLGTWQKIFFFEGDGPRNRKVYVEVFSK